MNAPKAFRAGTHRTVPPEETVNRLRGLVPAMGITRVANVTGLDKVGIPVVIVCRPNSRSLAVSQGKGVSLAAATASGLMEAAESYHAERVRRPLLHASYEELRRNRNVADVTRLPKRSASRFHPHLRMLWIEGRDLFSGEPTFVPYEAVHADFSPASLPGDGSFIKSSNGLASGNHFLEAVSHALCELVERDAQALWELQGEETRRGTRVDLASVDDETSLFMLERCRQAGIQVAVWEMTQDVGIPVFRCHLIEVEHDPIRPMYASIGSGCHPSRGVALSRAIAEAAQSRLTAISGARDDIFRSRYNDMLDAGARAEANQFMAASRASRRFSDSPGWEADTIEEDVALELARLETAGVRSAILVDLTDTGLGIPVARAIVPGLEFAHEGWAPGERARAVLASRR
jgi:ribosomal protein S12 methylthiotransferase accessory factor